jgi:hypothetical protein
MTPPAATITGRTLPRTVAPRAPRRVSGPARPAPSRPAAKPRHREDPRPRTGVRRAPVRDPFIVRAIERTIRMADSRFLDRLIRGRLWIPLVAAGLMGIVFMQVSMLKLNAGIGRAVQASSTLERQNSAMRAEVSGMESGSKIYAIAKDIGMVASAPTTTPSYVKAGGTAQASAAARRMTPADPDAVARAKAAAGGTIATALTGTGTGTATTGVAATTTSVTPAAATTGTATTAATTATTATSQTPTAQTQTQAQQAPVTQQAQTPSATGPTETPVTAAATEQPQTATSTSGGAVAPPAG